jgi:hypothetical protein
MLMRKAVIGVFALAAIAGLAYLGWCYYLQQQLAEQMAEAPIPEAAPPPPPAAPAEPRIAHPIVADEAPVVATTTVDNSDKIFSDFVALLLKSPQLPDFVYPDRMLRRFVATVDNLPRKEISARLRPVRPVKGMFLAEKEDSGALHIAVENDARYERYIKSLEAIDMAAAARFYATHYALFQKAYRELGYPEGHFNDRLFEAIDDMLATPVVASPIALIQPKVLYRYADAELEGRSAGQKIMLRMGPSNGVRVKAVLGRLRTELLRYGTGITTVRPTP